MSVRPAIVWTADLPDDVEAMLLDRFDARLLRLRTIGASAFVDGLDDARAIVASPGDRFDAALIAALPASIGLIASYSTGLDHIDLDAADARGIIVTNTPDVLTDATADIVLLLILATVRGAMPAARLISERRWAGWQPADILGHDLKGRTLGIFGGGRIGTATARRAAAFGLDLCYHSRSRHAPLDALGAAYIPDRTAFLGACDILSLHAPSTAETWRIIDTAAIAAMRPGAFLINTARGDLVDDDAVIAAAMDGRLAGVGLDVFAGEPQHDPRYLDLPNACLLPHIGSSTHETRMAMGRSVIDSLIRHLGDDGA